jgi:hypothetical protein
MVTENRYGEFDHELPAITRASFCEGMLNAVRASVRGEHPFWPEAISDEAADRIEDLLDEALAEIHAGSPSENVTGSILKRLARP